MSALLIATIVIVGVSTLIGYFKGLILTVYSMVSWIIAFVLVTWLTPYATDLLTPLIPEEVPTTAIGGIIYLIVLVAVIVALRVAGSAIGIISNNLPVLSTLNKIAGLAFGFVRGALIACMVFALIRFASATETGANLIVLTYQSEILTWIYENNPFIPFIQALMG